MADVPSVPWGEPIAFVLYAVVTTLVFEGVRRWRGLGENGFSLKWTSVVFFGFIAVPGWIWSANQGHWRLFALGTVLLAVTVVLITWRTLASARKAVAATDQGLDECIRITQSEAEPLNTLGSQ
jgi:hypothetical protein